MKTGLRSFGVKFLIITAGMSALLKMSAIYAGFSGYFIAYFLIYGAGVLTAYRNRDNTGRTTERKDRIAVVLFSVLFALLGTISNYYICFLPGNDEWGGRPLLVFRMILVFLIFTGIYTAANSILTHLVNEKPCWKSSSTGTSGARRIFLLGFFLISVVDLAVLLTCKYPGSLSGDSMNQVMQIMTGSYSNHHPFFHTMVIKLSLDLGTTLFGSRNAGIAVYCVLQILFLAVSFSTLIMTLYEMHVPRWIYTACLLFYILVPYHIMYSITLWKDVPFAGFVLLVSVYAYRCVEGIGRRKLNFVIFAVSGVGMCIFRSNGFFAFLLFMICFTVIMKREGMRLIALMCAVIVISYMLKYVTLSGLDIAQPDTVESLSIPLQQVAKVAASYNDFSDSEREELQKIIDIDDMITEYRNYLSDPVKELIRKKGNQDYLKNNKMKFLKLYISVGLRHPVIYTLGWIDQTCGYLNAAGYPNKYWYDSIDGNSYGIERVPRMVSVDKVINEYMRLYNELPILQIFMCIGIYVWLLLVTVFVFLIKRDRTGLQAAIPCLAVILSLLIATPVSAEFRYAYSLFCTLPFLLAAAFKPDDTAVSQ